MRGVRFTTIRQQSETLKETVVEGWSFIKEVSSFRYITLAVVALIVAETALEYHFLAVSDATFQGDVARYQAIYSLYQLIRTIASITILGLFANRVIGRVGLKNSFLVLPAGAIGGAILMLLNPTSLLAALGGLLSQKLPQYTIDESARKSFQALAPERIRGRVSMFMDSYLYSAGTIAGSIIIGAIVFAGIRYDITAYVYVYLGVCLVASLLALWAIQKMRLVYDISLLNWRLQRRKRGRSVLDELSF
jgi:MFS family permease